LLALSAALPIVPLAACVARAAEPGSQLTTAHHYRIEKRKLASGTNPLRVRQGERVTLAWLSDEAATLHLHGYNVELVLEPGAPATMAVHAYAAGRFPLTAHRFSGKPAHGSGQKERALLYLEVHPN